VRKSGQKLGHKHNQNNNSPQIKPLFVIHAPKGQNANLVKLFKSQKNRQSLNQQVLKIFECHTNQKLECHANQTRRERISLRPKSDRVFAGFVVQTKKSIVEQFRPD